MRGHEDRRGLSEGSGARAGQWETLEEVLERLPSPSDPVTAYSDGPEHHLAGAALQVLARSSLPGSIPPRRILLTTGLPGTQAQRVARPLPPSSRVGPCGRFRIATASSPIRKTLGSKISLSQSSPQAPPSALTDRPIPQTARFLLTPAWRMTALRSLASRWPRQSCGRWRLQRRPGSPKDAPLTGWHRHPARLSHRVNWPCGRTYRWSNGTG